MNAEFIAALQQLEQERNIDKEVLLEAIEAALISAYRRHFNSAQNVRVHVDRSTGDIRVYARKTVVEKPTDPRLEISLEEARSYDPSLSLGDVYESEVTPREFGRIAAQTAKQVVVQRIREAERGVIFEEFHGREGDVVTGTVHRMDHRTAILDLGRAEAILAPTEQIPGETIQPGDRLRAYILEVRRTTKGPQILVSRTHPGLLRRLMELEVPEIKEGTVELRAVAREAGSRSKVAVQARVPHLDPIGACIGPRGARVEAIRNELRGEKLDIVLWDPDPAVFVRNALQPARVLDVQVEEESKVAHVLVPDNQLSLAIGREGQNARLAAKLTGLRIDIRSEGQRQAEGGAP